MAALVVSASPALRAQMAANARPTRTASTKAFQTDSRWLGWLGCWQTTRAANDTGASSIPSSQGASTCIIPIGGSSAVEMLTVSRGKVIERDRLDATGPPHAIDGQGCQGSESVNWSTSAHRALLRSDYSCSGGNKGTSLTVFAISPSGQWLSVVEVRSGGGAVVTTDRRNPIATLSVVPSDAAAVIAGQQLAITTARAAAAAPITPPEIVDAVERLDAGVVRAWLASSDQRFRFSGEELASLARADVPQSVLRVIMANPAASTVASNPDSTREVDEYLNRPVYSPSYMMVPGLTGGYGMYECAPGTCAVANPYSDYNGYSGVYYPYAPYAGYPVVVEPGFVPFRRGPVRQPVQPVRPRSPLIPGPVGRRP
ncbi:MAG TPA: hypothetical protein VHV78_00535 [Gemmatimonadaceae bacterium]|jgi:hypothetical protein|nr:hypothetical protein [Gemmatimonadaceae bacterium]